MHLKYCSMTGADDEVDIQALSGIAKEYPFVEWAILLLPGEEGTARCPSLAWIKKFKKEYKGKHTAIHLCGQALIDFASGKKVETMSGFPRIQLNLKFMDAGNKIDLKQLATQVKARPDVEFIIQYTDDKKNILPLFKDIPNHALLFDASAGAGINPDIWPKPVEGHFCGYAGGIGPENVADNLKRIEKTVPAGYTTWIDMESKIRTDDKFDLKKVRRVLEIAKPHTRMSS